MGAKHTVVPPPRSESVNYEPLRKSLLSEAALVSEEREKEVQKMFAWLPKHAQMFIAGSDKAGKSTLVNKLCGKKLAPVGGFTTTMTPTSYLFNPKQKKAFVVISTMNGELSEIESFDSEEETRKCISLKMKEAEERAQSKGIGDADQDEEKESEGFEFKQHLFVSTKICPQESRRELESLSFIDTQGLSEEGQLMSRGEKRAYVSISHTILVSNMESGSFLKKDILPVLEDLRNYGMEENVTVVITHVRNFSKYCKSEEELQEFQEETQNNFIEDILMKLPKAKIFFFDPAEAKLKYEIDYANKTVTFGSKGLDIDNPESILEHLLGRSAEISDIMTLRNCSWLKSKTNQIMMERANSLGCEIDSKMKQRCTVFVNELISKIKDYRRKVELFSSGSNLKSLLKKYGEEFAAWDRAHVGRFLAHKYRQACRKYILRRLEADFKSQIEEVINEVAKDMTHFPGVSIDFVDEDMIRVMLAEDISFIGPIVGRALAVDAAVTAIAASSSAAAGLAVGSGVGLVFGAAWFVSWTREGQSRDVVKSLSSSDELQAIKNQMMKGYDTFVTAQEGDLENKIAQLVMTNRGTRQDLLQQLISEPKYSKILEPATMLEDMVDRIDAKAFKVCGIKKSDFSTVFEVGDLVR